MSWSKEEKKEKAFNDKTVQGLSISLEIAEKSWLIPNLHIVCERTFKNPLKASCSQRTETFCELSS